MLCGYSLEVAAGDLVLVEGPILAQPLFVSLAREITRHGAHPVMRPKLRGRDDGDAGVRPARSSWHTSRRSTGGSRCVPDKFLDIWAESNTRRLNGVPAGNQAILAGGRAAR